MSLGFKSLWRVRPRSPGSTGLSLLPGRAGSTPPLVFAPRFKSLDSTRPTEISTTTTTTTYGGDDAAPSPPPRPSPGAVLVESLANVPVRQHGKRLSVLVEPLIQYPHPKETLRSRQRHHRSLTRQARLEAIRQAQLRPLPDWRTMLQRLIDWTPEAPRGRRYDAMKIAVPADSVRELVDGTDNDVLRSIGRRTGCVLELHPGARAGAQWSLSLCGTAAEVDRAAEEVLRIVENAVIIRDEDGLEAPNMGTTEEESSEFDMLDGSSGEEEGEVVEQPPHAGQAAKPHDGDDVYRPYILKTSAANIPKPAVWTQESFSRYVAALTNARPSPLLASSLYPPGTNHRRVVIDLLHRAFNDAAARGAITTSAFKAALAYMCRDGESHRPDARALFVRMEMFGLPTDAATFNIMLASQVKTRDLRNFGATLLLMNGRGHAPDLATWLLFLRLFENEEVKRHVVHAMHAKGLLDSRAAVRRVAAEMAPFDADRAVQQNATLASFLAEQEARYGGQGWLTREAGNRIVEVLGRYGRFADCGTLIDVMRASPRAAARPDVVTFNTLLTHCKVQNSLRSAVAVVRHMDAARVAPDRITYHLLFEAAWQRRLPFVLGVIWRCAALAQCTSHRMRVKATRVLRGDAPNSRLGSGSGTETKKQKPLPQFVTTEADGEDAKASLQSALQHEAAGPVVSQAHLGNVASKWYATRYAGWELAAPLGRLLQEALDRDNRRLRELRERRRRQGQSIGEDDVPAEPLRLPLRRKRKSRGDEGGEEESTSTSASTGSKSGEDEKPLFRKYPYGGAGPGVKDKDKDKKLKGTGAARAQKGRPDAETDDAKPEGSTRPSG